MPNRGTLYVIAAPSGAGKTSLVKALVEKLDNLLVSVSYTTRPKRPSEQDSVNYHFVTQARFEQLIAQHDLLEYANVFGYFYGTSKKWVQQKLEQGVNVILEIDWQGASQIGQLCPQCVKLFILPPSLDALQQRLKTRQQDSEAVIAQRLAGAQAEIAHCHEFDYLIVNEDFNEALAQLCTIFQAESFSYRVQRYKLETLLQSLLP
jgi:guanylate kinase